MGVESMIDSESCIPLYQQVMEMMRQGMMDGSLAQQPDRQLLTTRELAQQYGVSVVTISRAINEFVQQGILRARPRLGTYLAPNAVEMLKARMNEISITVAFQDVFDGHSTMLREVAQGAMEFAHKKGVALSFFSSNAAERSVTRQKLLLEKVARAENNGVILAGRFPVSDVIRLQQEEVRFVWLGNNLPNELIHSVTFSSYQFIRLALSYFQSRNVQRVGLVDMWWDAGVTALYRHMISDGGFDQDDDLVQTHSCVNEEEVVRRSMEAAHALLDRGARGIFAVGEVALGSILQVAQERGLRVPDDLELVLLVHSDITPALGIRIPKVVNPVREATVICAEMLQEWVQTGKVENPKRIINPYFKEG